MRNRLQPFASKPTASPTVGEGAWSSTPHSALRTPRFKSAFTLIEILVVISIIAILTALILATAGYAMSRARRARVETELATLETAIQSYKSAKGFYPQDNPNNYSMSPLFYELTGTTVTIYGSGTIARPSSYYSATTGDTFNAMKATSDFFTVYGAGVTGFVNASSDPSQVQNFFGATGKSARVGHLVTNGVPYTIFGVVVSGPVQLTTTNGSTISPWFYTSSNPANTPGSYDLWMDVYYSGKTNRISNWSRNPQPQ
jgi:prepilin-type N-terminal cleavage/methylation domain-containing protein